METQKIELVKLKREYARMRKREVAIVNQLDLDDIDLVTERLKLLTGEDPGTKPPIEHPVPKLDL